MALTVAVYQLTKGFSRDEQFGLTSQIRRAVSSIPANIAEGYGRGTRAAYAGFLRIARGSLRETETHLELCQRLDIGNVASIAKLLGDCDRLGAGLHGLITKLGTPERLPASGFRLPKDAA